MRVTDRMIFERAASATGKARERVEEASAKTSSGIRVEHPWDDPSAAGRIVGHRVAARRNEAIAATTLRATDELRMADESLSELANLVVRAKELAVQFSNDTYNAEHRAAGAEEIRALFSQAVSILNLQAGDRYIFGGNRDSTPPFDALGTYLGDTGVRQVEIAPGVLQDGSIRADVAMKGAGGGVDVFATFTALITALDANDATAVHDTLSDLETGLGQVVRARVDSGVMDHILTTASNISDAAKQHEVLSASRAQDADIFQSASEFALAQRALEAALTASAQSFRLTMLDVMR